MLSNAWRGNLSKIVLIDTNANNNKCCIATIIIFIVAPMATIVIIFIGKFDIRKLDGIIRGKQTDGFFFFMF